MNIFEHIAESALQTKIGATIASIIGVMCMAIIWKPKAFANYKKYELWLVLCFYGVAGGMMVGGINKYLGISQELDTIFASGVIIGACTVGIFNLLAALFRKMEREDKDITELKDVLKDLVSGDKKDDGNSNKP